MKKIILGILFAALLALNLGAQTNSGLGSVAAPAQYAYDQIKGLSFTNGFKEGVVGLRHGKDYGVVDYISTANTNGINAGFLIGAMQENKKWQFYEGGLALSANGTYDAPLAGKVNVTAEVGAVANLKNISSGVWNQSVLTFSKTYSFDNGNCAVTLGGGPVYFQKWNAGGECAVLQFTSRLRGKHLFGIF